MYKNLLAAFSTVLVVVGLFSGGSQAEPCERKKRVDHCNDVVTGLKRTSREDKKAYCGNYYMMINNEAVICQESTAIDYDCGPMMFDKKTCDL